MELIEQFEKRLIEKENKPDDIKRAIELLHEFKSFLDKRELDYSNLSQEDFYDFSNILIERKINDYNSYGTLVAFGQFTNNQNLIKWGREVFDGGEVIYNLSKRLEEEMGKQLRDDIFQDIELPPIGISPKEKPKYTKILVNRLISEVDEERSEKFLAKGLRDPYTEWRKPDRERFLKSKNIDEFLAEKKKRFIKNLEKHRDEGTLFFTQEINDEVIDYVKNTPYGLEGGIREGNKLRVSKIPHETIKFLNETDEKMRAYYYCHCPWVKESMKDGTDSEIPDVFCNCSGGYYKDYWQIVLNQPIEVKLLQSVKKGDPVCEFEVQLPDDIVEGLD